MKLQLKDIKTTSPRVRQTQDPEELDALAASIGALNQAIIPVGVRKNGDGYYLVYGHRRVAAAKQAGLKEIDAIEVEIGDDMLKVYGLIENVVRENMTPLDIAHTLQQIKDESGWTEEKIAKMFGHNAKWVNEHLQMLDTEIQRVIEKGPGTFSTKHLVEVKAGLGKEHRTLLPAVVEKVAAEGLSKRQARHVAEEAAKANVFGGTKAVKRALSVPYEQMRDTNLEGHEPSEAFKLRGKKPQTADYRSLMNTVDSALRTLEGAVSKLANTKQGRSVIASFVPRWIKTLRSIIKILEAV